MRRLVGVVALACAAVSCGVDDPVAGQSLSGSTVVSGLDRPTQMAIGDDGFWYVAQLAGEENEVVGEVVRADPADPSAAPVLLLDGLDKPTGVAVFDGDLWVMERRSLSRFELDGSDPRVIVEEMAFNNRSEGALTVDGDRLLFNTSGRIATLTPEPIDPVASGATLWAVDADNAITPVATGFKHAYAQTRDGNGVLWTTEIADGTYDDQPAPDELVAITPGSDHGWPRCVGDNRAVAQYEGTAAACAEVPGSQAVFPVGATPTGIAIAPWDPATLLVALWVPGEVVAVSADPANAPAEFNVVYRDAERPQSLLVNAERVLLIDHAAGTILALSQG